MPAHAQLSAPSAVRASDNVHADVSPAHSAAAAQQGSSERSGYELPTRAFLGVGGAFLGALSGAYVGAAVIPHGPCGCDDPGLNEAIEGAMVGSVLLGAVLAAAPEFSAKCHPVRRIGYGVLGAVTGAVAGGFIGAAAGGGGVILGYLTGAGVGAGVASGVC